MCPSSVKFARPKRARTTAGNWKYIVNTGDYTQTLRLEICMYVLITAYLKNLRSKKKKILFNKKKITGNLKPLVLLSRIIYHQNVLRYLITTDY